MDKSRLDAGGEFEVSLEQTEQQQQPESSSSVAQGNKAGTKGKAGENVTVANKKDD